MARELLKQVRLLDPITHQDRIVDILIIDGYIQNIAPEITDIDIHARIYECKDLVIGPGLVDLYSHCGEPGFEERETLACFLQSAVMGGFTRVNVLPDTLPVIDHPGLVAQLQQKRLQHYPCSNLGFWGAMTLDLAGKQLTEFKDLVNAGVVGFTDSEPWTNLNLVKRVLEYLQPLKKPIAFWPCDRSLAGNGIIREGTDALRIGLPSIPASAETTALAALLEIVGEVGTAVHIMRVSTARSVDLIATAKAKGLPVTASTTWMHLLLDTKCIKSYDTSLHLQPPLGNNQDMLCLRDGVRNGVIDAIAIDHAAYTYEEKMQAFAEAPPGAIGLQIALPLLWHHLVSTGEFTALELWGSLSSKPAACLQQSINPIKIGEKAELTLFNPEKPWIVNRKNLGALNDNTPWLNQEIRGTVIRSWFM
ncbi:dihydroorotase [Anabaena sp. FACHB-1237]|uniref:dihydroorotase n=1 Tax=Anabaena sp. FACHB-1237 TaxID=2692769 RepID=UPI00168052DC|nr:dihydroorotase [Anabaena sp. FACHB-1237]MBD2138100.1 dihydroorotase [Anabaena sp. FACHB-1237]